MNTNDLEKLKTNITNSTDDKLIAMVTINANYYIQEIIEFANKEIQQRGIQNDVQEVIFDYFVNSDGFAGRLILLEEQLLFLSIGMKYQKKTSGNSLIAQIGHADAGRQTAFASKLDFSGLENEGSWICYLDEIVDSKTELSWLSGNSLTIRVKDEEKDLVSHLVKSDELPKPEFIALKLKIENAKNKFVKLQE